MIAMTNKICIKPPRVNEVTTPRSHKTIKIIAIVVSIVVIIIVRVTQ